MTQRIFCYESGERRERFNELLREHRLDASSNEMGKLDYSVRHIVQALNMEVGVVRITLNKLNVLLSLEVVEKLKANLGKYY